MNALKRKIIAYADLIQQEYGITLLIGLEQELNAIEIQKIDVEAAKELLCNEALARLAGARSLQKITRARNILDALQQATCAEHLLNIEVYDELYGLLEHRGSPELHGIGYYDMPGNIEFRTLPVASPKEALKTYRKLYRSILFNAAKLGLKIHWRSEHLNFSIWQGGQNLTSVPAAINKALTGRILVGMLDTNEEVRLLIPGQALPGRYVNGGPTRLDSIRIVNNDASTTLHRFEQRDTFRYGKAKQNLPYRLLIMLEGVLKGIRRSDYDQLVQHIKAVHVGISDRTSVTRAGLSHTYRSLMRLELGENYAVMNIDLLFDKQDYLFGGVRIGDSITMELTGAATAFDEDRVKRFYRALRFNSNTMILPLEPEFESLNARLTELGVESVKVYDSLRVSEIFLADTTAGEDRVLTLREHWGPEVISVISGKRKLKALKSKSLA